MLLFRETNLQQPSTLTPRPLLAYRATGLMPNVVAAQIFIDFPPLGGVQ